MAKRRRKSRRAPPRQASVRPLFEGRAAGYLVLALLVVAAYFPALNAGFVWDDIAITEAKPVADWLGIKSLWLAPRALPHEAHYWPITYTSFWIDHKIGMAWTDDPGGFWAPGFHATSLAVHVAVCAVLWRLLCRLRVPGAWFAAAIFAVHPVHAEPVVWAIGRKELLAAFFYFLAVLQWINFIDADSLRRRRIAYAIALLAFIAALLSKSIAVTLPAALLIAHWRLHGRVAHDAIKASIPFFLIGGIFAIADTLYYKSVDTLAPDYSLIERLAGIGHALWFYLGKLIAPIDLYILYPKWSLDPSTALAWLPTTLTIISVLALTILGWRRHRGAVSAIAFFIVALSPYLGVIQFGFMEFSFVADRYQYIASAGPIALAVAGLAILARPIPRAVVACVATVPLLCLSVLSWKQASIYENKIVFFEYIVSVNPGGRGARSNLAQAYIEADRTQEGLETALELVRLEPNNPSGHLFVGTAFMELNRPDDAYDYLQRALALGSDDSYLFESLGMILNGRGQHAEALELLQRLVRTDDPTATYSFRLAVAYFGLGRHDEALFEIERGLALDPDANERGGLNFVHGQIMSKRGDLATAAELFEQSYRLDGSLVALNELAVTRFNLEEYDQALEHFATLADADPNSANNRYRVGVALVKLNRNSEALEQFRRTIEIDPSHEQAREMITWLETQS